MFCRTYLGPVLNFADVGLTCRKAQIPFCLMTSDVLSLLFRTLFDYDPSCDAGLPGRGLDFRFGHILNVVGDDDADWWHAVRVVPDDGGSGVVPSKRR